MSQGGWKKGKNVLLGLSSGFFCVMVICALFCYQLTQFAPAAAGVLKYAGAAYIAYLAVYVALSRPGGGESGQMTFMKSFLLQFVNVKIIMYAITVYTGYVLPHGTNPGGMVIHTAALTLIGLAGNLTWAAAGGLFQKFLKKYYRPFNIAMALVLLWFATSLAFGL